MKKLLIKLVIFIAVVSIFNVVNGAIQPLITADLSVQSQLADSNSAKAGYDIYVSFLEWSWVLYVALAILMFHKEIKKLFIKGDKKT